MSEYELRLIDGAGALGEYLPDFTELMVGPSFSEPGAISFEYPVSGVNYALLAVEEAEVALTYNGVEIPDGRFYMQDDEGDEVNDQGPRRKFIGRTAGWVLLDDAIVYPPDGSVTKASQTSFTTATPGTIMSTLIQRAQTRGASTPITYGTFTATLDSNGAAWTQTLTISYDVGVNLMQVLQNLVDQGVCEVRWDGRALKLFKPGTLTTDRTTQADPVILRVGVDIKDAPRKRSSRDVANVILMRGDEDVLNQRTDPTSLAARRRRESYVSQGGVKDTGTLNFIAGTQLSLRSAPRIQKTYGLKFTSESPRPWNAYFNGDFIWIDAGAGLEKYRVRQISLTQKTSDDEAELALVLNDKLAEREIMLSRKIAGITGGATLGGGSSAVASNAATKDTLAPATPSAPSVASVAYLAADGTTQAQVTLTWAQVTTNTDGTAITDLAGYEVQVARSSGQWIPLGRVDNATTTAYASAFPPGITAFARLRAFDSSGNLSAWSAIGQGTTASDATPPPTPSTPTVDGTTFLGAIRIRWNGLDNGGAAMPLDFKTLEVHASLVNNFTPDTTTRIDEFTTTQGGVTTWAASNAGPTYVKFIAVDRSGNRSPASAQASATASKAVTADLQDSIVTAVKTNIAALNAATGDLNSNTVNTLQLAASAVTAAKTSLAAISSSTGNLNNNVVGNAQIVDAAVTAVKTSIAAISSSTGNLNSNTVNTAQLVDAAISTVKIATGAITAAKVGFVAGGTNTLYNSSFESSTALEDWVVALPTAAVSTAQFKSGTKSAAVTRSGGATALLQGAARNQFALAVGDKVVLSASIYLTTAMVAQMNLNGGPGADLTPVAANTSLLNQWQRISTAHTITTASASYKPRFYSDAGIDGTFYVDDVQFEFGEILTAYGPRPDEILPGTIGTTSIADNAITTQKIIANAVTANQIAANAITAGKIAADAVTANEIAANSITASELAANSVVAGKIAALTVTAAEIAANTITAAKIAADTITANEIATNAITANEIAANAVTAGKINANAVTAGTIAANAVTAGTIAAGVVTANEIGANAVTAVKIQAGAITTEKLTVGSASEDLLLNGSFEDAAGTPSGANPAAQWIGGGTATRITSDFYSGSAALEQGASGNVMCQTAYNIPAKPGDIFVVTGAAKKVTGTTGLYYRLSFRNSANAEISISDVLVNVDAPTSWTQYSGQFLSAPAGTTGVVFQVYNVSGTVRVDGFELRRVVISAQIQDGAIVANKIAALAITAEKLTIGSFSDNMVMNGGFEDTGNPVDNVDPLSSGAARWSRQQTAGGSAAYTETSSRGGGNRTAVLYSTGAGAEAFITSDFIPVNKDQVYFFSARVCQLEGTTGGFYYRVHWYTQTKTFISQQDIASNLTLTQNANTVQSIEGQITSPSNAAYCNIRLYNSAPSAASYKIVDDVTCRKVTVSAQIGNGQIIATKMAANSITAGNAALENAVVINAKIANLAVDDAKMANVSISKLTAGSINADMTVSARIKTADSGGRVELNSSGLQAYNGGGSMTAMITTDGSFKTATSGSRIEISAGVTGNQGDGDQDYIKIYSSGNEPTPATIYSTFESFGGQARHVTVYKSGAFSGGSQARMLLKSSNTTGAGTEMVVTASTSTFSSTVQVNGLMKADANTAFFRATNPVQTIPNTSWTVVQMNTVLQNRYLNAGGGGWVVPFTGTYLLTAVVNWPGNATGGRYIRITADGSSLPGRAGQSPGALGFSQTFCTMGYLTAGQTIRVEAYQSSGGSLNTVNNGGDDQGYFSCALIHALP